MKLIDQHTKAIMEECKARARAAGLRFEDETLEYVVSNRDMIELSPKGMIPTLYDFWANDVEVLKKAGEYSLYPHNPYETVINSRPAISFYNDNNPDWLNIMIFYHVIAHIDFFQNNAMFKNTWQDDFVGKGLADKRLIASLRTEHGRWLDYVLEFARGIDNITGYFEELRADRADPAMEPPKVLDFYFGHFLQEVVKASHNFIFAEVDKYNRLRATDPAVGEAIFLAEVKKRFPEFQMKFDKHAGGPRRQPVDLLSFLMEHSPFIKKEQNHWMRSVLSIVRSTALYFEPQIRTKTINEGWASYWHDTLFRQDERIRGHEVAYARINAAVTSVNWIGLNPYAIGLRLIQHVEEQADKGKLHYDFQRLAGIEQRRDYDLRVGEGKRAIFGLRQHFSDFTLVNTFVSQEFVDRFNLFVVGKRLNPQKQTYEYYVKSRKAQDYKQMLIDSFYHPARVEVDLEKTTDEHLHLRHRFEGKQLYKDFVPETLMGISYLWGGAVSLETMELTKKGFNQQTNKVILEQRPVAYTFHQGKLGKRNL